MAKPLQSSHAFLLSFEGEMDTEGDGDNCSRVEAKPREK